METSQKGAVAVMMAAGIVLILGMVALAVDLGHLYVVRSELRRSADAGAMAGVRALFPFPLSSASLPLTPNCGAAQAQARDVCQANPVEGDAPEVVNLQTGSWDWSAGKLLPGCATDPFTNALTVTVRRDNVPLTVAGALGLGPYSLQATATAVMDWVGSLNQGEAFVLMLGKKYVQSGDVTIYFSPAPLDSGGWYAKDPQSPSNSLIKGYLANQNAPAISVGDNITLNNGAWPDVIQVLAGYIGKTVWVPVVDTSSFNQSGPVLGFTAFTITEVSNTGSDKYVRGTALPLRDAPESASKPGGVPFGLLTAPRVVQ